jgi:hypothetical protein
MPRSLTFIIAAEVPVLFNFNSKMKKLILSTSGLNQLNICHSN